MWNKLNQANPLTVFKSATYKFLLYLFFTFSIFSHGLSTYFFYQNSSSSSPDLNPFHFEASSEFSYHQFPWTVIHNKCYYCEKSVHFLINFSKYLMLILENLIYSCRSLCKLKSSTFQTWITGLHIFKM